MDQQKISYYKAQLEKVRKELAQAVKKDAEPEDFGSDSDHFEEEANEAEVMGYHIAAGQTLKDRVNEIDMALNKMTEGKYGICETCGHGIEEEVLRVSPESRFCKKCKKSNSKK